ncbi:MAG: acetyl-CoA carboxylase biotin carboxylase subunit [Burkholderiaceae bacterium]|nr:acetyl-CoA carboxylase biotin carboxylase subunit [Burkholderiaceae bacterium]
MTCSFTSVLIANRGEIAVRVIRAAQELGIRTIAVYSDADQNSLHVRLADQAVNIGPYQAAKSYLNINAILDAAKATGAQAIHPGYGFLSENAAFADAVRAAGLVFIGPSGDVIRAMGDKVSARQAAVQAGVPVVPGSDGLVSDLATARQEAARIGYPVMIKATAGGGGRGIRVCADEAALVQQWPVAQAEAQAAFGNGAAYLERFIPRARHIEVQILGDGQRAVHLFERECSLQRRRQKVWEEAPSPSLDDRTRKALCESAVRLAETVRYSGAGTLEYLYDDATGEFFFIEMNTRIQVEHPITEAITGIDLVREMILIAGGQPLRLAQSDISYRGAAIEVRLNAEDPAKNFFPKVGRVEELVWPGGPGVRIDSMLYPGYDISPYYDSLLAKLIVHAENRPAAIARLARALGEIKLGGLTTTASLHTALARNEQVRNANYHTGFLEPWLAEHAAQLAGTTTGTAS